jgi:hypothetical protein
LAFFRFTEADACTLISAYGLHALEENRLQNNRSNEPYQSPKDSPTVPSREQQVVERLKKKLAKEGPLPAESGGRIYQKLVEEMRNWEAKLDAAAPQSSSQPAATGGSK